MQPYDAIEFNPWIVFGENHQEREPGLIFIFFTFIPIMIMQEGGPTLLLKPVTRGWGDFQRHNNGLSRSKCE
jgi:hypothetical protein